MTYGVRNSGHLEMDTQIEIPTNESFSSHFEKTNSKFDVNLKNEFDRTDIQTDRPTMTS